MSVTVPIKVETLTAFGDEARRIIGSEDELSTSEMLDTFGNAAIIKNQDITINGSGIFTPENGYTGFGKVIVESGGGGDYEDANEKYY